MVADSARGEITLLLLASSAVSVPPPVVLPNRKAALPLRVTLEAAEPAATVSLLPEAETFSVPEPPMTSVLLPLTVALTTLSALPVMIAKSLRSTTLRVPPGDNPPATKLLEPVVVTEVGDVKPEMVTAACVWLAKRVFPDPPRLTVNVSAAFVLPEMALPVPTASTDVGPEPWRIVSPVPAEMT